MNDNGAGNALKFGSLNLSSVHQHVVHLISGNSFITISHDVMEQLRRKVILQLHKFVLPMTLFRSTNQFAARKRVMRVTQEYSS